MRGAILLFVSGIPLFAQQASVEGTASDAASHAPLPGVHVRLFIQRESARSVAYGARSDQTGHFAIRTINPGTYYLNAERTGFVYTGPRTIVLKPAQDLIGFKLEMASEAIISGRVFDENGDPVQGASIGIIATDSKEPIEPPQASATDEKGAFRAHGAPGKYYVRVTPPPVGLGNDPKEIFAPGVSPVSYVDTWFPASASKDRAAIIEAPAGQETRGIDIRLLTQKPLRITGLIKGLPADAVHALVVAEALNLPPRTTSADPDGKFTFVGVAPGAYNVMVLDAAGLVSRRVAVTLDNADVTNLELTLQGPEKLAGTLEMPGDRTKLTVNLIHGGEADFPYRQPEGGEVDKDGTFVIDGLFPGRYRVVVSPLPGNAYVKETKIDGAPANDALELSNGFQKSKLDVVVGLDGGELSGTVRTSDSDRLSNLDARVFLIADPEKIGAEDMRQVSPEGAYVIHGIRPGKYRLFAVDESQFGSLDSLSAAAKKAPEIEIKPGQKLKRDLMLVDIGGK